MNSIDKITRDAKILVNSARDAANSNLTQAFIERKLTVSEDQLREIFKIMDMSFEEGYLKAATVFQNTIKKHLT